MTHIKAQQVADDSLIDGIMSCDEDRFAIVFPGIVIESTARAAPHIFKIFAACAGLDTRIQAARAIPIERLNLLFPIRFTL